MRRIRRFLGKSRAENELDRELRFHIEKQIADNVAAGMSAAEAQRRAQLEFGGIDRVKEEVRDTRWETYFDNLFRDFAYAFRGLRKDRRFSLIAILALALGIGASTIVFSVVYNVFVHALPYKNFDRSVVFEMRNTESSGGWMGRRFFGAAELRAFREQNHVFEDIMAQNGWRAQYDNGRFARYWPMGAIVSANTFDFLGVSPLLGRGISPDDGKPGATPVLVMNYRLWQSEFGGDPKILGRSLSLDGKPFILVGIMPPQFDAFSANFWVPVSPDKAGGMLTGRLRPGVSILAAGADLDAIEHRLLGESRDQFTPKKFVIVVHTLLDDVIGSFKQRLYALLAAVTLLLLIACSNVANLLLARATVRQREMAMRATLGASRARLIRQLLVESFVLATAACGVGCALAYFGLKIVRVLIPAGVPPDLSVIRVNAPVLLLALGTAVLTTIVCGLAPALHAVRGDLQRRLTGSAKDVGGSFRHGQLRSALVVGEVGLSIVLLIASGLLIRSFLVLTHVDLKFDPRNVLYFQITLPKAYNTGVPGSRERKNVLTRQLLERMRAVPGVSAVAESMLWPPLTYDWSDTIIPGKPHTERWETRFEMCSETYFQLLGVPLVRGRLFSESDVSAAREVMVVNESFSRQYFPNEDPLGRKVKLQVFDRTFLDAPHDTYFEVVGIVRDYKTRDFDHTSWRNYPQVFVPYSVQGFSFRTFMARTAVDPQSLLPEMARQARALEPGVGIDHSGTLEGALHEYYRGPQFELVTLAAFASIGLFLVLIGIFSVMAYTVSLQTHEIGIRMALGAQQTTILGRVLLNGFRLVAAGILAGVLASCALTRFLASEISGVSATDPWTFAAVVALVMWVGLGACLLPARRAAQVDPVIALRFE